MRDQSQIRDHQDIIATGIPTITPKSREILYLKLHLPFIFKSI